MSEITDQPFSIIPQIWHRDGVEYSAILQSGVESFNMPSAEKQMDEHVTLLASDSPSHAIEVVVRGGANPRTIEDVFTQELNDPNSRNMIPIVMLKMLIGDRLTVTGTNHWVKLVGRDLNIIGVDSQNLVRRI